MLTNRVKLIVTIVLGFLLCVLACIGMGTLITNLGEGSSQAPVRSLRVTIDKNQRQELFDQLRKFADKHAFEYDLTDYGGQGEHFLVYILGEKVKILTTLNVEPSRTSDFLSINFYAPSPGDPLPDKQTVDNLVVDLKGFISEIPNVRITEGQ